MNPTIFLQVCKQNGLPVPVPEYHWHPTRKFRADFAWPVHKVILEVEGGVWNSGKHGRGSGIVKDIEKGNEAAAMGWRVLRCVPKELLTKATIDYLKSAILAKP